MEEIISKFAENIIQYVDLIRQRFSISQIQYLSYQAIIDNENNTYEVYILII